jgi:3-oxoacyl-[acyl-carrier protein] reductase
MPLTLSDRIAGTPAAYSPAAARWYALLMDDLSSKVALVTGASRGIGRAIALALAQAGADIAINFLHRAEEAETAAEAVRRCGRRGVIFQADVSVGSDVQRLIRRVEEQIGGIDILVNNAGIAGPRRIEDITEDDWDRTIAVNLKSCFLTTQAALPGMRTRHWGRIVNVSSVAAQTGGVVGPHYAASKAGMLGQEGITVNAIAPALVETEMVTANPNARPDLIPVGRYGLPFEVAQVAVMLALNGYITGQTINANGGWYMN